MSYQISYQTPKEVGRNLSIWAKPEFMQAVQNLHQFEAYQLCCYKGEQLVALLPVYEKRMLSYRLLKNPTGSYYQGLNLWLDSKSLPGRRLLDTLQILQAMAQSMQTRYKKIQFNLSPDTLDVRGFTWEKLHARPLYTFVHDYGTNPQPLPDERKNLGKALQQNYQFAEKFAVEDFMRLFVAMNGRKNRQLGLSMARLESFFCELHQKGLLRQFNLFLEDKVVSSNMLMSDTDKAYTVFRATETEAMKNGASSLHTLKLIEALSGQIEILDFCGANVAEVARFKAALGLQLKVFYQIYS